MTFEEFQATRKWADDLQAAINTDMGYDEGACGFVYHGDLHIFAYPGGTEARMFDLADGKSIELTVKDFMLVIGNMSEVSEDLTELEHQLYAWGKDEGVID